MRLIAQIAKEMRDEVTGAEHYAKRATQYKSEDRSLADSYYNMAMQELDHVNYLHAQVVRMIQAYKSEHGEPPEAMMMVWNWEHDDIVDKVSRVKVLLDMYKK